MAKETETKKPGKSEDDFRKLHDMSYIIPQRIKDGLAKLGPDRWEYESDFNKLCGGISNQFIGQYRDQFSDYWVETTGRNPKRCWCGSKELAKRLRSLRTE